MKGNVIMDNVISKPNIVAHNINYQGKQIKGYVINNKTAYLNWSNCYKLLGFTNLQKSFYDNFSTEQRKCLAPNNGNKTAFRNLWNDNHPKRYAQLVELEAVINVTKDFKFKKFLVNKVAPTMQPNVWVKKKREKALNNAWPIKLKTVLPILSHNIHVLELSGQDWFVGSEVTKLLEYKEISSNIFNYVNKQDYLMLRHELYFDSGVDFLWADKYDYRSVIIVDLTGFKSLLKNSKLSDYKLNVVKGWLSENFGDKAVIKKQVKTENFNSKTTAKQSENVITPLHVETEGGRQVVSARELYKHLHLKHRFADWVKQNFEYFQERVDYIYTETSVEVGNGGKRTVVDYAVTLDMAKQLCMMSHTPAGREYREYFIKLEKEYNKKFGLAKVQSDTPVSTETTKVLSNLTEQTKILIKQNYELTQQLIKNNQFMQEQLKAKPAPTDNVIVDEKEQSNYQSGLLNMSDFAEHWNETHLLKVKRNQVFKFLRAQKVLKDTRDVDRNLPMKDFANKGYFYVKKTIHGTKPVYTTLITKSGVKYLTYLLEHNLDYFNQSVKKG